MRTLTLFSLTVLLAGVPAAGQAPATHPDFSGLWSFNEKRSDDITMIAVRVL